MTKLVLKKTTTALVSGEPESEKSPLSSSEEARLKLLETIWRFLVLQDKRKRYKQFLNAPKETLSKAHIFELISLATKIFKEETTLIELEAPFVIFADIHGQYLDLLDMLDKVGWPPKRRFLFTGDYVDRGPQSIEVIVLLLYLKILFPEDVYLLRGNHESSAINSTFGFRYDCLRLYDVATWSEFQNCFNHLSIMALVSSKIICMHGGTFSLHCNFSALYCKRCN
uniref:Serine/threonine-protein phosphatase n=1 Tax=Romanomermis culicivorax TaxID=13658 RepID=A0A915HZ35_ROMCU